MGPASMRMAANSACKIADHKRGCGRNMAVQWDDLKVLLALSRGGSVAAAARELQVDNSTISRRLAALEEAMGAQLLIRGGRDFSWTCEGRAAVQTAQTMEDAVAAALRTVRGAKQELAGTVRVAVVPSLLPNLVKHLLPGLREAHPALKVELDGSYHRADLAHGEADLAVRMARPEERDLVARRAFELGWFVYGAHSYLARAGCPASHEDLRQHRLVLYLPRMHSVAPLRWMEQYHGDDREATRVDSMDLACNLVTAGEGLAVLPTFVGDRVAALTRVFPERVGVNTGWIVYHESVRDSARVRAVADALARYLAAAEPVLAGLAPPEAA
jgi:DNA-binding transcriptional LysR family regulator